MRRPGVLTALLLAGLAGVAEAQDRPTLRVDLRLSPIPDIAVSVRDLLGGKVLSALESGFPLSVRFRAELREERGLFDRTVSDTSWGLVVLYDPVRERYVVQGSIEGRDDVFSQPALIERLATIYIVGLPPDVPGRFYYKVTAEVRTLSDEDVDEAFAWLGGEAPDSVQYHRPDFLTRTTRRLLVRVAPLPQFNLTAQTQAFPAR